MFLNSGTYFPLLCDSIRYNSLQTMICLCVYFMLGLSTFLMYSVHEGVHGISLDSMDHTETLMPITSTLFAVGVDFHAGKHPSFYLFLYCLCLSLYLYMCVVTSLRILVFPCSMICVFTSEKCTTSYSSCFPCCLLSDMQSNISCSVLCLYNGNIICWYIIFCRDKRMR